MSIIVFLIVGLISGYLAGVFIRGRGLGILGDTLVGVVGSFVGGFLFKSFGLIADNLLGDIIVSFVGAALLLLVIKLIKKI